MGRILFLAVAGFLAYRYIHKSNKEHMQLETTPDDKTIEAKPQQELPEPEDAD